MPLSSYGSKTLPLAQFGSHLERYMTQGPHSKTDVMMCCEIDIFAASHLAAIHSFTDDACVDGRKPSRLSQALALEREKEQAVDASSVDGSA